MADETGRVKVGVAYAMVMGICGLVLIGVGETLSEMAEVAGVSDEVLGSAFLSRGLGQFVASPMSSHLFTKYHGNGFMAIGIAIMMILWWFTSSMVTVWLIHLWFLASGVVTASLDTGVQMLTRREFKAQAGVWLQINTFMFSTTGVLAPLVHYVVIIPFIKDMFFGASLLFRETFVYSLFALAVLVVILTCTDDIYLIPKLRDDYVEEKQMEQLKKKSATSGDSSGFGAILEFVTVPIRNLFSAELERERWLGLMIFLAMGGRNAMTAYIQTFINTTRVLDPNQGSAVLAVLVGGMAFSRLLGVFFARGHTPGTLLLQMVIMLGGCFLACLFLWVADYHTHNHSAGASLWIAVTLYSLTIGPILGATYDLQNQLRSASGSSTSEGASWVLVWMMNLGSTLMPFATALLWMIKQVNHHSFPTVLTCTILGAGYTLYKVRRLTWKNMPQKLPPWEFTFGYFEGSWPGLITLIYFIVVTTFFLLASIFPAMYENQEGFPCDTLFDWCHQKAAVILWFMFLWGLGFWALARQSNQTFRRETSRMYALPTDCFNGRWTNINEVALLLSVLILAVAWCIHWWDHCGEFDSYYERFNLLLGHLNTLVVSLLILLASKSSFWDHMFGVSHERSILYHQILGVAFFSIAALHFILWQFKWLADGDWVAKAIRIHKEGRIVSVDEGLHFEVSSCTWWEEVMASCGNGKWWNVPAMEFWFLFLGLPAALLSHPKVRKRSYELFHFAHQQHIILLSLLYYHAAHLWKFCTVGLVLLTFSLALQRVRRGRRACRLVEVEALPGTGVTLLRLEMRDKERMGGHIAGQYGYINIPAISLFEWHPFSISSAPSKTNIEWTHHIKDMGMSQRGRSSSGGTVPSWSHCLYRLALGGPFSAENCGEESTPFQVFADGPYGIPPIRWGETSDCVLLVAGGIGVTPMLALIADLQTRLTESTSDSLARNPQGPLAAAPPLVSLVWVVPSRSLIHLLTRGTLLQDLNQMPNFRLQVYVTNSAGVAETASLITHSADVCSDLPEECPPQLHMHQGRPDFRAVFNDFNTWTKEKTPRDDGTTDPDLNCQSGSNFPLDVCVCGPPSMLKAVELECIRRTAANLNRIYFHRYAFAL